MKFTTVHRTSLHSWGPSLPQTRITICQLHIPAISGTKPTTDRLQSTVGTYLRISIGCRAASLRQAMFASYIRLSAALPGPALPRTPIRRCVTVSSCTTKTGVTHPVKPSVIMQQGFDAVSTCTTKTGVTHPVEPSVIVSTCTTKTGVTHPVEPSVIMQQGFERKAWAKSGCPGTAMGSISCVQTMVWLPVMGILNVRTDVDACDCTRGCTDTIRESALETDSRREKKPCCNGDLNPHQCCTWPFSPMLCQLSCMSSYFPDGFHTMPGQHSQPLQPTWVMGLPMFSCNLPPALLAEWCAAAETQGTDAKICVSTESQLWRKEFPRHSCQGLNPWFSDHRSLSDHRSSTPALIYIPTSPQKDRES